LKGKQLLVLFFWGNVFYMAAYLSFRLTLTLYLIHRGLDTAQAYNMVTASASLLAMNLVVWSTLSRKYFSHIMLMNLGLLVMACGLLLLRSHAYYVFLSGLTLLVIGSPMYLTNLNISVNKMYPDQKECAHANNIRKLSMELGGVIGILLASYLMLHYTYSTIYEILVVFIVLALLCLSSRLTQASILRPNNYPLGWNFTMRRLMLLGMTVFIAFLIAFNLIQMGQINRYLLMALFSGLYFGILYIGVTQKKWHYLHYLLLLTLCSFIYWAAVSTLYNQMNVFLSHAVQTPVILGIHITPFSLYTLDSFVPLVLGYAFTCYAKKHPVDPSHKLIVALMFIALSYGVLALGIDLKAPGALLSAWWPAVMISLLSLSMFLMNPTLVSQTNALIPKDDNREFFVGGMSQMFCSIAVAFSYYMFHAHRKAHDIVNFHADLHLYCSIAIGAIVSLALYIALKRLNILKLQYL
jgi:dipeptide/tripeptide permease